MLELGQRGRAAAAAGVPALCDHGTPGWDDLDTRSIMRGHAFVIRSGARVERSETVHNPKAKLKTLYVMHILQDEMDAEHGLSLREIIERLGDYGIQAERKGLYSDIQTLREFGLDIQTFQRNPVQYAIVRRDFDLS